MFNFLLPGYVKKAKHLLHGVKKFIHYHRDLMPADKLQELHAARDQYSAALKARDKDKLASEEKLLIKACEKAVPNYRSNAWKENIEVIIVAITVALGIRAYFLQPFKIPTASMQPTLNGITATPMPPSEPFPNIISKVWQFAVRGRNYTELKAPAGSGPVTITAIEQKSLAVFATYTVVHFSNNETVTAYAPTRQLLHDLWLVERPDYINPNGKNPKEIPPTDSFVLRIRQSPSYEPGQVLARGYVDTGDQVLVDKVSYHFRQPKRGEVFVFSTKNIEGIALPDGVESQHYIKRLAAIPNDSLYVENNNLYHNGALAEEFGFKRVMGRENRYTGYTSPESIALPARGHLPYQSEVAWERKQGQSGEVIEFHLKDRQYFAMGDNSPNSSDSRVWGHVPEQNIVGPALMVYWPFQPHFWLIK
jgi:signal peptidase I